MKNFLKKIPFFKFKTILYGIGSILNIFPDSKYDEIISRKSFTDDLENLRSDWDKVGEDIKIAMQKLQDDQSDLMMPPIIKELIELIGYEAAFKIWEKYQRRQIYFPCYRQVNYSVKYKEIINKYKNGQSIESLAKEYNVTPR